MATPQIHTGSDLRHRVWDGDKFAAIYEPDDYASAASHLARLTRRRKAPAAPAAAESFELSVGDVPAVSRSAPAIAEDPDRVHLKEFSDGWRVWHPVVRSYVGDADRSPFATKHDAMHRARDVQVQIGALGASTAGRAAPRRKAPPPRTPPLMERTLFAPAEVAPKGGQIGFKFNARERREKGTPTDLNLWVLDQCFGERFEIPNALRATDVPHLRRCLKAGLIVADRTGLRLTPAGLGELLRYRTRHAP